MARNGVVRAGAVLGVIGGGLRAAGSFAPALIASEGAKTWLYVTIDVCLTAGLLSIYLPRHRMNAAGSIGFFLALAGLITVRVSPGIRQVDLYPIAASVVAIGVLSLAISEWSAKRMTAWIPAMFALALVLGGIGMFVAGSGALFILSGILFGCAFAAMSATALLTHTSGGS